MKFDKLIINAALTGIIPTKERNPHVPLTPKEIADDTKRVYEVGASIVHIHARDNEGRHSHKKEIYKEIIGRIRDVCDDIVITVSTSGRIIKTLGDRMEVLELTGDFKPDMASLTLGSMNFIDGYSVNDPITIISFLKKMNLSGIRPELEIFDCGMANYAKYLVKKGLLDDLCYCNLILGSLGTMAATPANLVHLINELPENFVWAATGVGRFAFNIQCLSIAMGGHVRVGIEDSMFMDKDKKELATNEKLVSRVRKVAEAMGREIATPNEVRKILNL